MMSRARGAVGVCVLLIASLLVFAVYEWTSYRRAQGRLEHALFWINMECNEVHSSLQEIKRLDPDLTKHPRRAQDIFVSIEAKLVPCARDHEAVHKANDDVDKLLELVPYRDPDDPELADIWMDR